MKMKMTFLKTILLAVILLVGSGSVFGATITINGADMSTTDGAQSITKSGIGFNGKMKQYQTTKIWFTSGSGYIYNTTSLGSITKITLSYNSGGSPSAVQRFNVGASAMSTYLSMGGTTVSTSTGGTTYDFTGGTGNGFFNISVSSKNLQLVSLVIEYTLPPSCTSLAAPTVTPTAGNAEATLSWDAVTNASSYTLIWNGGSAETVTSPVTKTGLTNGVSYSYSVMAVGDGTTYCATNTAATGNVTPSPPAVGEPTNHATSLTATANSSSQITVTWADATGGQVPDGYLIIASTGTPTEPVDGTAQVDDVLVKNIVQGTQTAVFTGLSASTSYNFAIWPYTNSGASIDYKIGSHPTASATTETPLGVPVATAATGISATGFTANWDAVSGATEYELNVYTKSSGAASDLFISEYIEGSSSNKYIEIFNGTGTSVDLSNYKLQLFANGSSTTSNDITLSGTLANGATVVYQNSSANLTLPNGVNASNNSAVNYNGDDAVALYKISTSAFVDIFGKIGEDPGSLWGTGDYVTAEKTLVRKSSVTGGVTTNPSSGFPTLSTEWDSYSQNTVSNLGSHTFSSSSSNTPISGSPFTVSGSTNKVLTGLSSGTAYYYTVVAKKGGENSVESNEISVTTLIPTFSGTGEWSETARWNTGAVPGTAASVIIDGTATVNSNIEVAGLTINDSKSLSVNAGQQLTVTGTLTNNGTINLLSGPSGTATLTAGTVVDNGTANVSQYLSAARNWYVASPVTAAAAPSGYTYYQRDEAQASWDTQPFTSGKTFIRGKGYIALPDATGSTLTFSGKLNMADTIVALTYSGASSKGFNLIGNPYPSHLTWTKTFVDDATNAALIEPSIYLRTNTGGSEATNSNQLWSTPTYNASSGAVVNSGTNIIPPMQAFWVRAKAAGNLTLDNAKLTRSHESSNPFKARAVDSSKNLRLVLSDSQSNDEILLYFNENASNDFDRFDSPKMMNGTNSTIPDLYTMAGAEQLVINGMSTIPAEIPLNFNANASKVSQFSLSATEIRNFDSETQIILKDKLQNVEYALTSGSQYNFTSDVAENNNRFSLIFRTQGAVTGIIKTIDNSIMVYSNTMGIIVKVNDEKLIGSEVSVYNALGQRITSKQLNASTVQIDNSFIPDVYLVKVNNITKKVVVK